jgi:uncharacterized protein YunC (DUF1805 family)
VITTKEINGATAVKIEMQKAPLLILIAKKGFVMCGYLNLETAEKLGDAACLVSGVSTFDDVLKANIVACTPKAKELGIKDGMTGREALKLFN